MTAPAPAPSANKPKWFLASQSAQSTIVGLMAVLVAAKPELGGLDTLTGTTIGGVLAIISAVLEFISQRKRGNTVLPA